MQSPTDHLDPTFSLDAIATHYHASGEWKSKQRILREAASGPRLKSACAAISPIASYASETDDSLVRSQTDRPPAELSAAMPVSRSRRASLRALRCKRLKRERS